MRQAGQRSRGTRKGEPSSDTMCPALVAKCTMLVRGSSRRIATMTAGGDARSANIRVINRRTRRFGRYLACLTKTKGVGTKPNAHLTGRFISVSCLSSFHHVDRCNGCPTVKEPSDAHVAAIFET